MLLAACGIHPAENPTPRRHRRRTKIVTIVLLNHLNSDMRNFPFGQRWWSFFYISAVAIDLTGTPIYRLGRNNPPLLMMDRQCRGRSTIRRR